MTQDEIVAIAASINTPEFILQKVDKEWDDNEKRVAALAFADAFYKTTVLSNILTEVSGKFNNFLLKKTQP